MNNIKNKVALITGAASGIGYKTAEELLRNGAQAVAILDSNASLGYTSAATLEKQFGEGRAIFLHCDVTQENQLKESFEKVVQTFNSLDIVINNAGMANELMMEQTINVNVTAVIRGSLLAIEYMGKHKGGKGGTLVNVASIAGLHPSLGIPIYTASKYAVVGFSRSLQYHTDKIGVRVLVMCPGLTATGMTTNTPKATLSFIDGQKWYRKFNAYPRQPVEHVARSIVELIQKGKNSTVSISEDNQPLYAVKFIHYSKMKSSL